MAGLGQTRPYFEGLLRLAAENDVPGIQQMLAEGCPPTQGNSKSQSALHIGALWGSSDAVKALLAARADVNAQNQIRGSAPLHAAAQGRGPAEKRALCVKLLIEAKGDPEQRDFNNDTPLDLAEDECVRLAFGGTPCMLHNAVASGKLPDVATAIHSIASGSAGDLTLDTEDGFGETALHIAVETPWLDAVKLLLDAKARPSIPNRQQKTPLHLAVPTGNHAIVDALLAAKAHASAVDKDLDHDPRFASKSFEEKPHIHRTALHYAAELGSVPMIRSLLKAKARVNMKDAHGQTALHLCLDLWENPEIDQGIGVRLVELHNKPHWNGLAATALGPPLALDGDDSNIRCPVLIAGPEEANVPSKGVLIKLSNLVLLAEETLDLLLEARADVNLGNNKLGISKTALHVAAKSGDATLASKVIAAGAKLDKVDTKTGFSALHVAARGKKVDVVRVLAEAKADLELKNSNGRTAADLAKSNGAPAELLALLSPTASVSAPQGHGRSLTAEERAALFMD